MLQCGEDFGKPKAGGSEPAAASSTTEAFCATLNGLQSLKDHIGKSRERSH